MVKSKPDFSRMTEYERRAFEYGRLYEVTHNYDHFVSWQFWTVTAMFGKAQAQHEFYPQSYPKP